LLIGDDAGDRRLHLKDLNGVVYALGRVVEEADLPLVICKKIGAG